MQMDVGLGYRSDALQKAIPITEEDTAGTLTEKLESSVRRCLLNI